MSPWWEWPGNESLVGVAWDWVCGGSGLGMSPWWEWPGNESLVGVA